MNPAVRCRTHQREHDSTRTTDRCGRVSAGLGPRPSGPGNSHRLLHAAHRGRHRHRLGTHLEAPGSGATTGAVHTVGFLTGAAVVRPASGLSLHRWESKVDWPLDCSGAAGRYARDFFPTTVRRLPPVNLLLQLEPWVSAPHLHNRRCPQLVLTVAVLSAVDTPGYRRRLRVSPGQSPDRCSPRPSLAPMRRVFRCGRSESRV